MKQSFTYHDEQVRDDFYFLLQILLLAILSKLKMIFTFPSDTFTCHTDQIRDAFYLPIRYFYLPYWSNKRCFLPALQILLLAMLSKLEMICICPSDTFTWHVEQLEMIFTCPSDTFTCHVEQVKDNFTCNVDRVKDNFTCHAEQVKDIFYLPFRYFYLPCWAGKHPCRSRFSYLLMV